MKKHQIKNILLGISLAAITSQMSISPSYSEVNFPAETTMHRLAEKGSITIGTGFSTPLFELKGLDGEMEGYDIEIGRIIAKALGIEKDKIQYIETTGQTREVYIQQGKADIVIHTYAMTEPRKKVISFVGPYYVAGTRLLVKTGSTLSGLEPLKTSGQKVCVGLGTVDAVALEPHLGSQDQMVQFDDLSKCLDAVRTGQVEAMAADNATLMGFMIDEPNLYKMVGQPFYHQPFGIGIKHGDKPFCEFIAKTLVEANADGRLADAWKKTAGQADPKVPGLPELESCQ